MKSIYYILFTLISLPFSGFTQESTIETFDLNNLIELVDMTKEDTHAWLTKDDLFTFIMQKEKYDGYVYGLNYNADSKIATIWLHKYYEIEELFLVGGKEDLHKILEQLTPYIVESNITNDGISIFSCSFMGKDIIVQIKSDNKPVSIKIIKTPDNESDELKIRRHKNMTKQN